MTETRNIWFAGKPGCGKTRLIERLREAGMDGELHELTLVKDVELRDRTEVDCVVVVVSAPDAALAPESEFLERHRDRVPLVGVATRIDLMPPAREWDPLFETSSSKSAQAVAKWAAYLAETLGVEFHLTACEPPDHRPVGIESAKRAISAASNADWRATPWRHEATSARDTRRVKARAVIAAASALAGASQLMQRKIIATGTSFGLQLSMLVALSGLYTTSVANPRALLRASVGLLLDAFSSQWGRSTGPVPAIVTGAVVTACIGETYLEFLETGETPQPEAFVSAILENYRTKGKP